MLKRTLLALGFLLISTNLFAGVMFDGFHQDDVEKFHENKAITIDDEGREVVEIDDMIIPLDLTSEKTAAGSAKWPNGVLIYQFDPSLTTYQRSQFLNACASWSARAAVSCRARTNEVAYVYVINSQYNSSYIGRTGQKQFLQIYNWNYLYIITHEIAHAFGFIHEQSRSDRDSYVTVNWGNIMSGAENNFYKASNSGSSPYDYSSIMHYAADAFSVNGYQTITVRNGAYIGQRNYISEYDFQDMIAAYGYR